MPTFLEPPKEWLWVLLCPFVAALLTLPLARLVIGVARYLLWNTGHHMPGKDFLFTVAIPIAAIIYYAVLISLVALGLRYLRRPR